MYLSCYKRGPLALSGHPGQHQIMHRQGRDRRLQLPNWGRTESVIITPKP
nr:MAG TPA: hypothetical protein [Caudoviricetes sp.]